MITEEEREKLKQEIKQEIIKEQKQTCTSMLSVGEIANKYHKQVYEKFGLTGTIDSAIRTVAVYACGQRYIKKVRPENWQKCLDYAEKLYKDILESGE